MTRTEEKAELICATRCGLGLLVNFGHYLRLEYERLLPGQKEPADVYL